MTPFTSLLFILLGVSFFGAPASAQKDTTKAWTYHTDPRASFIDGTIVTTWGLSVGRKWGPKEREVTLGYHWLAPSGAKAINNILQDDALRAGATIYNHTRLNLINLSYLHHFINTQHWKAGIPIEIGVGRVTQTSRPTLEAHLLESKTSRYPIIPLQLSGYVEWKTTRWIGFGLQTGYRWELVNNPEVVDLDGPFYRIRFMLYMPMYYDLRDYIFRGKRLRSPFWPMK